MFQICNTDYVRVWRRFVITLAVVRIQEYSDTLFILFAQEFYLYCSFTENATLTRIALEFLFEKCQVVRFFSYLVSFAILSLSLPLYLN